jgi:hypothetical protein
VSRKTIAEDIRLSRRKKTLKVATVVIGPNLYVVSEAMFAGKRNRFNVHKIRLAGNLESCVIAREVTAKEAEKLILANTNPMELP